MSDLADSPRCDHEGCENPSTMVNGEKRWCDEHPFGAADSPRTPDVLYADDGETVFVSAGETVTQARAVALAEGIDTAHMDADRVPMLPIPPHFVVDEDWWIVREGTPGAVEFWRFQI